MSKQTKLRTTAARWFIRMQEAEPDAPERTQFEAWLLQSPLHQQEYASFSQSWDDIDSIAELKAMVHAKEVAHFIGKDKRVKKVKNAAAVLGTCLVMLVGGVVGQQQYKEWQTSPTLQLAAQTTASQLTTKTFEDGTQVTLNASSSMDVAYYRHQRHVQLNQGEAIFEVTKDTQRPFIVETDTAKITVLGTRFAVNKLDNFVRVSVDHGQVRVESKDSLSTVLLGNGQVAEVPKHQPIQRMNTQANDYFKFVDGLIVFNQSNIYEIAEVLSRYRATKVIAQGTPHEKISAIIEVKDMEVFIDTLPKIANVKVVNAATQRVIQAKE
jgi:transmembrane sensor